MKKPQFSKIIVFIASILFILTLAHATFSREYQDTATTITEVTTTGTVFLTVCVWYYKKAATENTAKIRIEHAKEVADIEYTYFEKRARLQKELELTDYDMGRLDDVSQLDDMAREAISEDSNYISNQFENAASDPDIQQI